LRKIATLEANICGLLRNHPGQHSGPPRRTVAPWHSPRRADF
jgi:hypothetical protein